MKKWINCLVIFVLLGAVAAQEARAVLEEDLEAIVVTASRTGQEQYKLAGNVTVITRNQIEASNAQNIPDILRRAVGVHITDNSTVKSSVIDIRGFGDTAARNVLVMVNGRKINNVDVSGPDIIQVPIEAVDRIEIIRGAGSVLYGDNAVGGVINIITKRGKGDFSGYVGSSYGSYDASNVDLEVSGEKDKLSYYVYSKYNDQRGYRDNSDLLSKDFQTRLDYNVSEYVDLDFSFNWHDDKQSLPGGLTDAQITSMGRRATVNPDDTSYTKERNFNLSMDITPWAEDTYYGQFVVDYYYRNRDVYDEFNAFGPFHTKRNIDTYGLSTKYLFDRTIFEKDVDFVVGIDYYNTENDILGSGTNVDDIKITKKEFGAYGLLEYEIIDNLHFNGGTRYQQAEYNFDQKNVSLFSSERPDEWVSMGGVKYEYGPGSNVHFDVQQTFRFLATDEWYSTANFPGFGITPGLNTDLDQQTGLQFEAGVKHHFNKKVILSATPYYIKNKNEIFFDPVTFGNANYDDTRRLGVEVGSRFDLRNIFHLDFLDDLEYFANYTYINAEFKDGPNDGKRIPMVPENQVSTGIVAHFLKHFNSSLIWTYVGSRYAINDVLNSTPAAKPYHVLDGKLSYTRKHMEIYFLLNNIAGREYETYVSKSTFSTTKLHFPAPTRNWRAGVKVRW